MAGSTLKRKTPLKAKTPLRAKGGFKPRQPLYGEPRALLPKKGCKKPSEGAETAKKAKKGTRSSLETHLDIVFSLYIRLRDAMPNGLVRCISCGKVFPFDMIQCGHYHSRRSLATRWDEDNCHAECATDNCFNPDHLDGYKANLIAKIGQDRFDALNIRAHGMRKWSGDELRRMIRHYTSEARRLSKEKGIKVKI